VLPCGQETAGPLAENSRLTIRSPKQKPIFPQPHFRIFAAALLSGSLVRLDQPPIFLVRKEARNHPALRVVSSHSISPGGINRQPCRLRRRIKRVVPVARTTARHEPLTCRKARNFSRKRPERTNLNHQNAIRRVLIGLVLDAGSCPGLPQWLAPVPVIRCDMLHIWRDTIRCPPVKPASAASADIACGRNQVYRRRRSAIMIVRNNAA
jgi:hypothetical protein